MQQEKYKIVNSTHDKPITNEKILYNFNKETIEISQWSSSEIDKCEYLAGKEILKSDQKRLIKQLSLPIVFMEKLVKTTKS